MKKHLAFYETEWPANIAELTAVENKPFVGYLKGTGVLYTVIPEPQQPSLYEAVDLGLPSGLKWANMNVGATSPEDAGMYFQWGDTIGYTKEQVEAGEKVFNWSTYFDTNDNGSTFNKYTNEGGKTILDSEDDAATVHMGSEWRMPTITEFQELIDNTTHTFIDLQGNELSQEETEKGTISEGNFKGIKLTGSNGNSIFISAGGGCRESFLYEVGISGRLWSSSLRDSKDGYAMNLYFSYDGYVYESKNLRYFGHYVRGVKA